MRGCLNISSSDNCFFIQGLRKTANDLTKETDDAISSRQVTSPSCNCYHFNSLCVIVQAAVTAADEATAQLFALQEYLRKQSEDLSSTKLLAAEKDYHSKLTNIEIGCTYSLFILFIFAISALVILVELFQFTIIILSPLQKSSEMRLQGQQKKQNEIMTNL